MGRRLLQEDYFEHIVRSVDSLNKIRDYIKTNPARWQEDPENPEKVPESAPITDPVAGVGPPLGAALKAGASPGPTINRGHDAGYANRFCLSPKHDR